MKKFLRSGYTTGACAAAGVKAALILLTTGEIVDDVEITALDGTLLKIPVARVEKISDGIRAEVVKFSGDAKFLVTKLFSAQVSASAR